MKPIKQILFAIAIVLTSLVPNTIQAAGATPHKNQKSIEVCQACAAACESCATACLNESDTKPLVACIQLDRDCADMCSLCAKLMARDSTHAAQTCALCATICQACADECAKHKAVHCQQCAEACQKCADECRKMAK